MPTIKNPTNTPLSLSQLLGFHDGVIEYFSDKWTVAAQNERRWRGKNWTASEEADIKSQGRQPYSFPIVQGKLRTIVSTQRQSRTQFKIEASTDPQDEIKAELATLRIRDVERRSDMANVETDVFDSGLAISFGATKIYLDYSEYIPQIKVKKIDYKKLVWDCNSQSYDPNDDSIFVAELENVPRYLLENMDGIDTTDLTEGTTGAFEGREINPYYVTKNLNGNNEFDIISVFNHYQRVVRTYYCVVFPDTEGLYNFGSQIVGKYRTKKEAEMKLRELNIPYLVSQTFEPHFEGSVEEKNEIRMDRYKFTYNKILEYEETELIRSPYNFYFSIKFENEFVSFMESLKDLQIMFDRYWSQVDYAMGKDLKKLYELWEEGLADNETRESAMRKMNITGGVIFKKLQQQIVNEVQGRGVQPQLFQIADIIMSLIEDLCGGRSFQGLAEGAGESGVSIREKKAQGLLIAYTFMDNFSRFKKSLGENLLWWLQHFDTAEQIIKVHGAALTPEMMELLKQNNIYTDNLRQDGGGYVKLNSPENDMTYLRDAEFELTVTETAYSDYEREAKLNQLLIAEKQDPTLSQLPTFNMLKLDNMGIDYSDRQKILKEREAIAQAQAEAAKEAQNIEKAKVLASMPTTPVKKEEKTVKKEK